MLLGPGFCFTTEDYTMSTYRIDVIAALSVIALCAQPLLAAQTSPGQPQAPTASTNAGTTADAVKRAADASDATGAARSKGQPVRSSDGNELGEIHDFIIDGSSGKIVQVAVSTGGVLGVGNK